MRKEQEAEKRIDDMEHELARIQTEGAFDKLESTLVRERLQSTVCTAAVFAKAIVNMLDELGGNFDASIDRMASDLNGEVKPK